METEPEIALESWEFVDNKIPIPMMLGRKVAGSILRTAIGPTQLYQVSWDTEEGNVYFKYGYACPSFECGWIFYCYNKEGSIATLHSHIRYYHLPKRSSNTNNGNNRDRKRG